MKGNGETESLKRTELATNRQKLEKLFTKIYYLLLLVLSAPRGRERTRFDRYDR